MCEIEIKPTIELKIEQLKPEVISREEAVQAEIILEVEEINSPEAIKEELEDRN